MNLILIATMIFTSFLQTYTLGLARRPHQQIILENPLPKAVITHKKRPIFNQTLSPTIIEKCLYS